MVGGAGRQSSAMWDRGTSGSLQTPPPSSMGSLTPLSSTCFELFYFERGWPEMNLWPGTQALFYRCVHVFIVPNT